MRVLILFSLVFSWSAQARLMMFCSANTETQEQEIVLGEGEENPQKVILHYKFATLPDAEFQIEFMEHLDQEGIKYSAKTHLLDSKGKVLAFGGQGLIYKVSAEQDVSIRCLPYRKTDQLQQLMPANVTPRQVGRSRFFPEGGFRQYATWKQPEPDDEEKTRAILPAQALDLYFQVLKMQGGQSDWLRETIQGLEKEGLTIQLLAPHPSRFAINGTGYWENDQEYVALFVPLKGGSAILRIQVQINRNLKKGSTFILGYEIRSIGFFPAVDKSLGAKPNFEANRDATVVNKIVEMINSGPLSMAVYARVQDRVMRNQGFESKAAVSSIDRSPGPICLYNDAKNKSCTYVRYWIQFQFVKGELKRLVDVMAVAEYSKPDELSGVVIENVNVRMF